MVNLGKQEPGWEGAGSNHSHLDFSQTSQFLGFECLALSLTFCLNKELLPYQN